MIEGRAVVEGIGRARRAVEALGGKFGGDYAFRDIIFTLNGEFDLNREFLRVRVYSKNNWPTKDVVLIKKKMEFKEVGKKDTPVLRKEFDKYEEAFSFIEKNLPEYGKGFEYEREGWEYELQGRRVFVEDIRGFRPTVEVEADNADELREIFGKLGIVEEVADSVPETMRKIFNYKMVRRA